MARRMMAASVLLAVLLASTGVAMANDAAVGTRGAAVRPLTDTDIRMDSEAVQIICMDRYALYRIDFLFVNESDAPRSVKLGFPFPDFENPEGNLGAPPAAFGAWFNGERIVVTQEDGFDTDGESEWPAIWFTHEVTFPPGESMVTVSYLGTPDASVMDGELTEMLGLDWEDGWAVGYYPYLVHTGAGWAGPIGKTVVRYTLADDFNGTDVDEVIHAEASRKWLTTERARFMESFTRPAPGVYQWVYENYEPTRDHNPHLAFIYQGLGSETFDPWTDTTASSWLELGEYSYPAYSLRDGQPSTAWAEDAEGPGVGEWVDIPFGEERDVSEIRVLPGYQKRDDLFYKYNRPSRLEIEFSDGTSTEIVLADEPGLQLFEVEATADEARVTILDVYPGTNERDETYLSEITFAASPMPMLETYETVTGIAPPEAFDEPEALAPLVQASGAEAGGADDSGTDGETTDETDAGPADTADDGPELATILAVILGLLALASTTALVVVVLRRRGSA